MAVFLSMEHLLSSNIGTTHAAYVSIGMVLFLFGT